MKTFSNEKLTWPPPYRVRRSKRARHIRLVVSAQKGLEVVLPNRASEKDAIHFLNSKKSWVEKHMISYLAKYDKIKPNLSSPPTSIHLRSINRIWDIHYENLMNSLMTIKTKEDTLILSGEMKEITQIQNCMKNWLKKLALQILTPWLKQTSMECDLIYHKISFRGQKTLWGSCSAKKEISLNYKLLFLPPTLVDYVLVHELCHTKHMNHSKRFWQLVCEFRPDYRELEKRLRKADDFLPNWLFI